MRIIAGIRRGHRIESPSNRSTRPTSDMVRESIFNIIGSLADGCIAYDVFAGTGALGLEALSRGAAGAVFVERDRSNIALIRKNIAHLRFEDRTRVTQADAYRWMKSASLDTNVPALILIDPPYGDFHQRAERLREALRSLVSRLPAGSLVVLEMPERVEAGSLLDGPWDIRRYGSTQVGFLALDEARMHPSAPRAAEITNAEIASTDGSLDRAAVRCPDDAKSRFAQEVVRRLRENGYQALWAGGCVRDLLMGHAPSDYDVATNAGPEAVQRLFPRTVPVGVSFGVVRVLGPRGAGEVEVATFRTDGVYRDGRRPETVEFGTPEQDALRRDFTINGMFLDPENGQVIDYVGGMADLRAGIVRAIGDPRSRFEEDKLRLLRALRFTARFGFELDESTRLALRGMADQIRVVAAERIGQELKRMLVHSSRAKALALAMEIGILPRVIPGIEKLCAAPMLAGASYANAWEFTLAVMRAISPGVEPEFPLALAALLHLLEIEQGATSAGVVASAARRLRLSNEERDRTTWVVVHFQEVRSIFEAARSARKRLIAHRHFDDILALEAARAQVLEADQALFERIADYRRALPEGPIDPPALIDGFDLISLGLERGPRIRALLEYVRVAQLEGLVETKDQATSLAREWIAKSHE